MSKGVASARPRPTLPYLLIQFAAFLKTILETFRFESENDYEKEILFKVFLRIIKKKTPQKT